MDSKSPRLSLLQLASMHQTFTFRKNQSSWYSEAISEIWKIYLQN